MLSGAGITALCKSVFAMIREGDSQILQIFLSRKINAVKKRDKYFRRSYLSARYNFKWRSDRVIIRTIKIL